MSVVRSHDSWQFLTYLAIRLTELANVSNSCQKDGCVRGEGSKYDLPRIEGCLLQETARPLAIEVHHRV